MAIVLLFLSNIKEQKDTKDRKVLVAVRENLVAVVKIFQDKWILELSVISMALGMVVSFIIGDMTKVLVFLCWTHFDKTPVDPQFTFLK